MKPKKDIVGLTYQAFLSIADKDGYVSIGFKDLPAISGVSHVSSQIAVRRLIEDGRITLIKRGGGITTHLYRLGRHAPDTTDRSRRDPRKTKIAFNPLHRDLGIEPVTRFVPNKLAVCSSSAQAFVGVSLPRVRCIEQGIA